MRAAARAAFGRYGGVGVAVDVGAVGVDSSRHWPTFETDGQAASGDFDANRQPSCLCGSAVTAAAVGSDGCACGD